MIVNATPRTTRGSDKISEACNARVAIRELGPNDDELQRAFFHNLPDEARYLRFLSPIGKISDHLLARLTDIDQRTHVAIAATIQRHGREVMIGEARYVVSTCARSDCEFAVAISAEWQGLGLGRELLTLLERQALNAGLSKMTAETLPHNQRMVRLAHALGYRVVRHAVDFQLKAIEKTLSKQVIAGDSSTRRVMPLAA